ncbi:MAG: LytR C-terminal domain-containing protein [Bacteroidota bacterium]
MKSRPPLHHPHTHTAPSKKDPRSIALNVAVIVLFLVVAVLGYSLLQRHVFNKPVEATRAVVSGDVIQLDVLNGCGISRAASSVTGYLRARGYDVVEMRNYKSFDVDESLVIDRTGDLETARKVAYALGVSERNIVQQINQDYYVDVSVVIGKDYNSLKASR